MTKLTTHALDIYSGKPAKGLKVEALTSNSAVLTCLANDIGYDSVFSEQIKASLKVLGVNLSKVRTI